MAKDYRKTRNRTARELLFKLVGRVEVWLTMRVFLQMGIQVDLSEIISNLDETHLFHFQGLPQMMLSDVNCPTKRH